MFERMHYVCFHYEFEHRSADPDETCGFAGCPSSTLGDGQRDVVELVRELFLETATDVPWRNDTLPTYLEALGDWLANFSEPGERGQLAPQNGWEVMAKALQAATGKS